MLAQRIHRQGVANALGIHLRPTTKTHLSIQHTHMVILDPDLHMRTPIKHQLRKISSYDLLTVLLDVVAFSQMLSILHNQLSLVALEQCCTACYVRTISLYLTLITNKLHCSVSMVDILLRAIGCIRCPHDGAKTHLLHKPPPLAPPSFHVHIFRIPKN